MKNNKIFGLNIFARIGKTPFSSDASEILLNDLVNKVAIVNGKFQTKSYL